MSELIDVPGVRELRDAASAAHIGAAWARDRVGFRAFQDAPKRTPFASVNPS